MLILCRVAAILLLLPLINIGYSANIGHSTSSSPPDIACNFLSFFEPDPAILVACLAITSHTDTASTNCTPNYVYDNLVNNGLSWKVITQKQDQNNLASPTQVTFTATSSTTVTVTDEQGLTLSLGVPLEEIITASVQAHINHKV